MIQYTLLDPAERGEYVSCADNHPNGTLFHSVPWLDFICAEHGGVPHLYRIQRGADLYGYWPLIALDKRPFRLLGSPLRGWLTTKMGPLSREPGSPEVIAGLHELCLTKRISYLETAGDQLGEELMRAAGFTIRMRETWLLKLAPTETEQWEQLEHNCRKNIKKAERSGVEVRETTVDGDLLKALYDLVVTTYQEKGLAVPYGFKRLEALRDTIGRAGRLLFLAAFHEGRFVGGHMWGFDRRAAYAFVSASEPALKPLRVNNLLIWEGIKRFIAMGLQTYDMYGGGKGNEGVAMFKKSFGAVHHTAPHYSISYSKTFSTLLHWYERCWLRWRRYPTHL